MAARHRIPPFRQSTSVTTTLRTTAPARRTFFTSRAVLAEPTPQINYQPPTPTQEARPNIYKQFGRPFAKVFLGAMFTYQVLYWAWEKTRIDEIRNEKSAELAALEAEVQDYTARKGETAGMEIR